MPELPEVETIRLQLVKTIVGLKIKNIEILNKKTFVGDPHLLISQKINEVKRYAKILVIEFSNGLGVALHLKMSGQLLLRTKNKRIDSLPNKHTRVIISFSNGDKLYFQDIRKFGWMRVIISNKIQNTKYKILDLKDLIGKLGPDPLAELDEKRFYEIIKKAKTPIKIFLMDQEKIAGIGNIYSNEALFLARIHPKMRAGDISRKLADKLLESVQRVLKNGIKWGGASQNNYLNIYGEKGEVQEHFMVYSRCGEKCVNQCGGEIKRIVMGGRSSFYCPFCQTR